MFLVGSACTLTQAVREMAARLPDRGITIFDSRGCTSCRYTSAELLRAAELYAGRWAEVGLQPLDRILIARPTAWDWVASWLGALFRGAIPLAVAPGRGLGTSEADLKRIQKLTVRFQPRLVLMGEALYAQAQLAGGDLARIAIPPRALDLLPRVHSQCFEQDPRQPAFLQLTSGTSGEPRAVAISHRAVLHNVSALDDAITEPVGDVDAIVSWLPLYHDMGLVGALLLAIVTGRELVLLPPAAFLGRPLVWLEQLGRGGQTVSGAPNFAFDLCRERLAGTPPSADLSRWRAAVCGAEMISACTMRNFAAAFQTWGFDPASLRASYGLAEATVAVTVDRKSAGIRSRRDPNGTQEIVCVGEPIRDTEIRIKGPDHSDLAEGEVGEICVRGPGVFDGYISDNGSCETSEILRKSWLHTGDLGFVHDNELYVTGRSKDVLIVRGEKLMPQELESIAEAMDGGAARAAAFSVPWNGGGEQAILVVETEERDPAVLAARGREIRARIGETLALPLADLVFVRRGSIPCTTSGKIQRAAARDLYIQGHLQRIRRMA